MQRLKTRPQFQAVLAGKTLARTTHFALHCCSTEPVQSSAPAPTNLSLFPVDGVWMGAMVPKRWAKRAVTRNAIKRQIYAVSAEFEGLLSSSAHLVRLRSGFDRSQYVSATSAALKSTVRAELVNLFGRAESVAAT